MSCWAGKRNWARISYYKNVQLPDIEAIADLSVRRCDTGLVRLPKDWPRPLGGLSSPPKAQNNYSCICYDPSISISKNWTWLLGGTFTPPRLTIIISVNSSNFNFSTLKLTPINKSMVSDLGYLFHAVVRRIAGLLLLLNNLVFQCPHNRASESAASETVYMSVESIARATL